jgi:hypothetical protein
MVATAGRLPVEQSRDRPGQSHRAIVQHGHVAWAGAANPHIHTKSVCRLCQTVALLGYVAPSQIKQSGDGGKGLAIAGIVLGWVGVAVLLLVIVFGVILGSSSDVNYS